MRKFIDEEHLREFQRTLAECVLHSASKSLSELLVIRIAKNIRATPATEMHNLMRVYEKCTQEVEECHSA